MYNQDILNSPTMSHAAALPIHESSQVGTHRWMIVIFNNDTTPFEAVIDVLMLATKCDLEEASIEAWEAHHLGKAPVHFATKDECDEAASLISRVGIRTEVLPEWND